MPLTKLVASGFKSLADPVELPIGPLNLLCGANSSGKSSLLQALLLLSQSANSRLGDRPIALNGYLVDLGVFSEVVFRNEKRSIDLEAHFSVVRRPPVAGRFPTLGLHSLSFPLTGYLRARFADDGSSLQMHASTELQLIELHARTSDGYEALVKAERRGRGGIRKHILPTVESGGFVLSNREYRFTIEESSPVSDSDEFIDPPARPIVGLELQGIVPAGVWRTYDPAAREAERVLNQLLRPPHVTAPTRNVTGVGEELVWTYLTDYWSRKEVRKIIGDTPQSVDDARRRITTLKANERNLLRALVPEYISKVRAREKAEVAFERQRLPSLLEIFSDGVIEEFGQLRRLGPLREAPRPLHSFPTSGDPRSVGSRGEYTAAVLHRHSRTPVSYFWEDEEVTRPLGTAVAEWLTFLGVHSGAQAVEFGKMGHLVGIDDPALPRLLDLTQVGVGVSQILPVVVQALIAPPGSTLLLEQPELHLHPAVQSRLADFLIGVTRANRTLLCETHSEYLVNRLRILVTQGVVANNQLRVFFVSRFEGSTHLREVMFAKNGTIPDWPPGFFDQSVNDAIELVDAAVPAK